MRIRRYELVFILPPDLEESKEQETLDRLGNVVEKLDGVFVKREDWGVRKLAYEIKGYTKGHYYLMDFAGSTEIVAELERHLKMIEGVLRFLTMKKEDHADLDVAKQEKEEEREKKEAKDAALATKADETEKVQDDDGSLNYDTALEPATMIEEESGEGEEPVVEKEQEPVVEEEQEPVVEEENDPVEE